jgi:2-oxoglutarate dehydrogenase E1 component
MSHLKTPFPAVNADFVIDLYHRYLRDPAAVDASWKPFFEDFYGSTTTDSQPPRGLEGTAVRLLEAFRQRGHLIADLDPLGLRQNDRPPDLQPQNYGLDEAELDRRFDMHGLLGLRHESIRTLCAHLEEIYAGTIGFDCAHVVDHAARSWLYEAAESGLFRPDAVLRRSAAARIIEADEFEQFMNRRFVGKKRFGAEGAEGLLPCFDAVFAHACELGVKQVIIGGTARGRINVMANIVGKPLGAMFFELKGHRPFPDDLQEMGDIPYHLGYANERQYGDRVLKILYCHNPSHLEAIDPVALGRVRAHQRVSASEREGWSDVLGVLVHTDAAFAGQGLVAEVLQLSGIPAYRTGGTIHIVINNQVGFTTDPENGRTSIYCTDVAKTVGAPVFHVNGDDIDAVVRVAYLAAEYRHRFGADVVVDLVCYRRRGHNEVDEPSFTQPVMYRRIAEIPTVRQIVLDRLAAERVLTPDQAEELAANYRYTLDAAYEAAASYRPNRVEWLNGRADGAPEAGNCDSRETGLPLAELRDIGLALSRPPDGIVVNPKVLRQLGAREEAIRSGKNIAWAFGEALAYGSLASEGVSVRLSGQDTPRGAFSQRHFILHDQNTGVVAEPLNMVRPGQARCDIIASPLAEYAVLGFEYGYSVDASDSLVIWESQFGDFANTAQVIIDQFISSGEDKWLQQSGIVLLLPHGSEGQGPDHSSGRIERFLQLCAGESMTVANCTTPANFFHLLRRHARRKRRRPLIAFTPKSLLRHRLAVSRLDEFGPGTQFQPVLASNGDAEQVRRVILCSGKFYYELLAGAQAAENSELAFVRLEQLHPFPEQRLREILARWPGAHAVWCQEEPLNMGAWTYVDQRVGKILREIGASGDWPCCVGRPENASTSTGTVTEHETTQAQLVQAALGLDSGVV